MKHYDNWTQVYADALTGSVKWSDATHSNGLYPFLITAKGVDADHVRRLLAIVKGTEPNEDWVKGGWLGVSADGKILINPTAMPKPLAPSVVPGLGGTTIPNPFEKFGPFNALFAKNLWIRVAEFAVGALLLVIGANALVKQATGVDAIGTGTRLAKSGAKLGAVL